MTFYETSISDNSKKKEEDEKEGRERTSKEKHG